ncbi:Diguanylate cyclase/phosphodiesterase with PAS/PAC and GAF sensor(S) [uncultured Pleomorphomonas sp.]|uniref:Diguanylate cyclase/phosphodiesterase with PAS/PAC and GAF sensor(S) n=1 Tax=uncultured Pleomorphomonas sp. TaxID=442121 RepID=A0A212LM05_9HYPH|nr:EAL domain-containing protein [uncultured Pleomorphomonas sp.]SCM78566.1 Diguanylate cyclase/phosphodiesterase with PAS/PAC and GAF sensor(S) [uncultured Pleomorphomonas sp.]
MNRSGAIEKKRLRELYRYRILDTPPEPEFDGLCELARSLLGADVAVITFQDTDRSWCKASAGRHVETLPRSSSVSEQAVLAGEVVVYEDLANEPLFRDHPLVRGDNGFRSAVGVPIEVKKGLSIGAVVLMFGEPRTVSAADIDNLLRLTHAIIDRLHLRRIRIERELDQITRAKKDAEIAAQKWEIGKQRRLLEQTARLARIGGWEYDVVADRMIWSAEIYRLLELDETVAPPNLMTLLDYCREEAAGEVKRLIVRVLTRGESFETEIPLTTTSGRRRWARCVCEAEVQRGKVVRLLGTVQDTTLQRATEEEVNFIATHDMVTGLLNRAVFQERLDRALTFRTQARTIGLYLIDVDHFKSVNDTLGHHAGDVLLAEVGRRLREAVGELGIVARLGGDEFALLMPDCGGEDELTAIGEQMMRGLQEPIAYDAEAIPVTISVGIARAPSGTPADQLFKDADIALYEAKGEGRNRFVLFDRAMREAIELRHSILRAIRQAIDRGDLRLHYQPKYSLRTGVLAGFEALLRWHRPDGFIASPGFFGIALDDPQLGLAIGDMVIREAVRQAADWRARGIVFDHVAINVATPQFRRGDLCDCLTAALDEFGVPPAALMVEVTENVLLSKVADEVQTTLSQLADKGIKIALDDFGTGYASLSHLKDFPVDLLKIDRSFVATLTEERESRSIVRGITALAHDLGIPVIAEGVETTAQRDMLRHFGVDFGQGYLFSRAMLPAQIESSGLVNMLPAQARA